MKQLSINKLKDYEERTWWLGTDILAEEDLELMSTEIGTSMEREEGAMYNVSVLSMWSKLYEELGYSQRFCAVVKEANSRGYHWVIFDRDIETEEVS